MADRSEGGVGGVLRRGPDTWAAVAGIAGATIIALAVVVTALAYSGGDGEPYSPLNHFVSELGAVSTSELAAFFNLALIAGGICFIAFMSGLAWCRRGVVMIVAGIAGVIAGIGGALVGVLPMDVSDQHIVAALTFFNLGWIAVGLGSIDFVRRPDPRFPTWLSLIGAATVILFIGLVVEVVRTGNPDGAFVVPDPRPDAWSLPILEWLVLVGIIAWVLLTGITWLRGEPPIAT